VVSIPTLNKPAQLYTNTPAAFSWYVGKRNGNRCCVWRIVSQDNRIYMGDFRISSGKVGATIMQIAAPVLHDYALKHPNFSRLLVCNTAEQFIGIYAAAPLASGVHRAEVWFFRWDQPQYEYHAYTSVTDEKWGAMGFFFDETDRELARQYPDYSGYISYR
jgi:hypothetical protein